MDEIVWIALCLGICILLILVYTDDYDPSRNFNSAPIIGPSSDVSSVNYGNSINTQSVDINVL